MQRGNRLKTYQKDFKQSAIQMAISSDRPMSHIAKELGINDNTLYNWVGTYRKQEGITLPQKQHSATIATSPSADDELKRLRKENARLKMECDILKKATAYFAKETL